MDLHGVIAKVEALGVELEHDVAAEARKAWEFLKAELEKLRPHAHPQTGVIAVDPQTGQVIPPEPASPTATESNQSFVAAAATPAAATPAAATPAAATPVVGS